MFPEQLPEDLPPGVRQFSYLPFSQIMPCCAAIVYPGGIGTMAQAILAAQYNVRSIPNFAVFSRGQLQFQQAGLVDAETMESWLTRAA